ncbi:hypothetical protein QL093DRAFT_1219001 [Fusarium oxysporum]|nr:hypothetical protein QL093DRAFT_1219001 [Fusarium oxysporum]
MTFAFEQLVRIVQLLPKNEEEEEEEEEDPNNNHDKNHSREGQRGDDHQDEDGGFTTWLNDLGEITDEEEHGMEVEGGAAPGSPEELVELLFGLTLLLCTPNCRIPLSTTHLYVYLRLVPISLYYIGHANPAPPVLSLGRC